MDAYATTNKDRRRTDEALRHAALAVSSAEEGEVFRALVRYLATILEVDATMIAVFVEGDRSRMRTLASFLDGRFLREFEYELEGSPCASVVGRDFRFVPSGVRAEFPRDTMFATLGFDSYAAYPLNDGAGAPLGLIAALHRKPMLDAGLAEAVLKIFAVRASAEIERQSAGQALRASEASYRAIFEASEDPIFVHDWDTGAILDISPKASEVYGYAPEEMRRISVGDLSSGQSAFTLAEAKRNIDAAKSGRPVRFEWHAKHKDGHLMWHEVTLKAATIAGEPRVLAFTRDITARKLADQALRASEEQYRAVFNASVDSFVLRDADFRIVDVNPAYVAMTGYSRKEVLGKDRVIANPPESNEVIRALHRRALHGEAIRTEVAGIRKDGGRFEVELRGVSIQYRGMPHVLYIGRDITSSKRAEQALRASEEQYRAIFHASLDGLALWDAQGRVVDVNPAFLRMHGYWREELLGTDGTLFLPEAMRRHCQEKMNDVLAGTPCQMESRAQRKDGSEFDVEIRGVPMLYQDRPHVLVVVRDTTERMRAEDDRTRLEAQLLQAQKMEAIGHLTGGIAHDFNNLLTGIMGYVVLAGERQSALADAKLGGYLSRARLSCERARDLIQQMLTFSRGQRGEPQPVALHRLARESVKLLRSSLPSTVEMRAELDSDATAVMIDPVQIEQVLLNLCINARDAMNGVGTVRVAVRRAKNVEVVCASCRQNAAGNFVELAVEDNGAGIAPEVLERMFEPFFSTKEVGKGSGMGLATVHGIVHKHGGHVVVETEPGRGARFRILLPALDETQGWIDPGTDIDERGSAHASLSGRVLVVDDEATVAEFMRDLLQNWGLDVVIAADAAQAWDVLERDASNIDLVITDQTMPRTTGVELARALRDRMPKLPVIVYTGYGEELTEGDLAAAGVRALLRKPIEPATLLSLVREHLRRREKV